MANPSKTGPAPDDDSWGKIASDLFGIQFNDDDDFELPDDDAPVKKQPIAAETTGPVKTSPVLSAVIPQDQPSPEPESEERVDETRSIKASISGNEDHDEFWDILESWNWDESSKKTTTSKREEEPQGRRPHSEPSRPDSRQSRREETPRREQPPRRDDNRSEGEDRPRRRDAEPARETSVSGGDDTRSVRPQRDESRRERPPRGEQPPRTRRPETDRPPTQNRPTERPVPEKRPERSGDRPRSREASAFVTDDFGSGVDEIVEAPRSRATPPVRKRDEPVAPRKPVSAKRTEPSDDFEGDLFVEDLDDDAGEDESFEAGSATGDDTEGTSDEGENGRPRRRRRRRRRGRGRVAGESPRDVEFEEPSEADASESDDEAEEEIVSEEVAEDDQETDDEQEARRPRRRRRRRGRRPDSTPATGSGLDDAEELPLEDQDDDIEEELHDDDVEILSDDPDEEVVIPVSYEGMPTWEEAISYLVITPPHESRGPNRGRGDGNRRNDSRRR